MRAPGSKSVTNRALIAGALARGQTELLKASFSDDSMLLVKALAELGFSVGIRERAGRISVEGRGGEIPQHGGDFWLENAGSSLRFLTSFLTLGRGAYRIDGNERMRQRPVGDLIEGLAQLGAQIGYLGESGCPPLKITADGLAGGNATISGGRSSQFVSSILLSAPAARSPVTVSVGDELVSAPYVELTRSVMRAFGVEVARPDASTFVVAGGAYASREYAVAGDAASANVLYGLAAATGGEITVEGLDPSVPQPESGFVEVLKSMGCTVRRTEAAVTVRGGKLAGVDVDMNSMPDSVQTLAVLAVLAEGPTRIRNVAHVRLKETDRLAALERELGRVGAGVKVFDDGMQIDPPARPKGARINTYDDHRMAMNFALLGAAIGGVVICVPEVVTKSYPRFFEDLQALKIPVTPEAE